MIERLSFNIAVDLTGTLALVFILPCFSIHTIMRSRRNQRLFALFLTLIAVLLSDLVACLCRGRPEKLLTLTVANTATFFFSFLMARMLSEYIGLVMALERSCWKSPGWLNSAVSAVFLLFLLTNPLHGLIFTIDPVTGLYRREVLYCSITVCTGLVMGNTVMQLLLLRCVPMKERLPYLFFLLLPLGAALLQAVFFGYSLTNIAALLSSMLIFTHSYSIQYFDTCEKELELQNTRAALVLSQIQPHFLFNSMATVMDLCDTDPQEAKDALQELSDYLHYKISAMSHSYAVSFSEDLEFLQSYLKLEKRRFGSRLNIAYDIGVSDFQIPLLTLQPLVENAIRHGLSLRPAGGTVRVTTREEGGIITVLVEDDGVGFDPARVNMSTEEHVGLSNVRTRLAAICRGSLTVRSTPGVGTCVEITVRKEAPNDHTGCR